MEVARRLRNINKEDAIINYIALKTLECNTMSNNSRAGLACLDYFLLKHRIKAKTKRHISFFEALKDKKLMEYIDTKVEQIKKVSTRTINEDELLRQRYSVFQLYYGTINQFRPSEAKRIYCILEPKIGVLDFCAGWGGRCLGAMAYGVPYIGIDANTKMESSYKKMIETVEPNANVSMIFKPSESVDFSKLNYDLVFTSPPYFMLEEYENMPQYSSRSAFLEKFFRPVVASAWKNLRSPGHMALNMPKEMYDAIKDLLPKFSKRLRLTIANRHPTNAVLGKMIGEIDNKPRSEGIYIWKKGGNKTRKMKK